MRSAVRVHWKAISIPKRGNRVEENEDHYCPTETQKTYSGPEEFVCALADGATQASFSSLWARFLVEEAVAGGYPGDRLSSCVAAAQNRWEREIARMELPWHASEKVKQGAFATLTWFGLRFSERGGAWQVTAVGDSCLVHLRGDAVIQMFPAYSHSDFQKDPVLLSSIGSKNQTIHGEPERWVDRGEWIAGDEFLLMSDALAAWFIGQVENGSSPAANLRECFIKPSIPTGPFTEWVEEQRASRALKNDDTTLLWLRPEHPLLNRASPS